MVLPLGAHREQEGARAVGQRVERSRDPIAQVMEEEAVIRAAAFRDIGVEDPRKYERRGARSTQGGIPEGKLRVGMVGWFRRPGKGVRNGGRTRTDPGEMPAGEESDAEP